MARFVLGPSVTVLSSASVGEGTAFGEETCFSLRWLESEFLLFSCLSVSSTGYREEREGGGESIIDRYTQDICTCMHHSVVTSKQANKQTNKPFTFQHMINLNAFFGEILINMAE